MKLSRTWILVLGLGVAWAANARAMPGELLRQGATKLSASLEETFPKVDDVRRVAVLPLAGDPDGEIAIHVVEAAFRSAGVVEVQARDQLKAQFQEEEFGKLAFVDERSAVTVKVPGVEALIMGRVETKSSPTEHSMELRLSMVRSRDGARLWSYVEVIRLENEAKPWWIAGLLVALVVLYLLWDTVSRVLRGSRGVIVPLASARERLDSAARRLEGAGSGPVSDLAGDLLALREEVQNAPQGDARVRKAGVPFGAPGDDDGARIERLESEVASEAAELATLSGLLVEKAGGGADAVAADLGLAKKRLASIRDKLSERRNLIEARRG